MYAMISSVSNLSVVCLGVYVVRLVRSRKYGVHQAEYKACLPWPIGAMHFAYPISIFHFPTSKADPVAFTGRRVARPIMHIIVCAVFTVQVTRDRA